MSLVDRSIRDLLAAFSSADPTPGGGSASALASAVGASLLLMVAGLPRTRAGSEEDRSALTAATAALTGLRQQLTEAIDADAAAYDQVVAAYKLPKATDEDQRARHTAIRRALRAATDVPLGVVRLSALGLSEATAVGAHGQRGASSDVGVAVALLRAGLHGARLNVEINLRGMDDDEYTSEVGTELHRLAQEGAASAAAADAALRAE
jgi:formiminotetrahydrofolate cyclodeaminase